MNSKKKSKNTKTNSLKEDIQKKEIEDDKINNSKEEEEELEQESSEEEKDLKKENNNGQNEKITLKNSSKNNSVKNLNSTICSHNNENIDNNEIKKHKRCVPLEIYKKEYEDKQTLLNQVELLNKEINTLNSIEKNEDLKSLDSKCKTLEKEKINIENVLLNQEKYVGKLKKKIEKLENQILKKNEEIVQKDNNIIELKEKIDELNNKLITVKQNFNLSEKKEIMKLNDKIINLSNEIEIKQSKIDYIDKRHKNLQVKYLKLLSDKRKMEQESLFNFSKKDKERNRYLEINNSTTGNKYILDSVKSYSSIKKGENINNKDNKLSNNSKNKYSTININLPNIQNKNAKKSFSLKKEKDNNRSIKKVIRNNALKDLNMLLSDYSEKSVEITNKKEDLKNESESEEDNENDESKN